MMAAAGGPRVRIGQAARMLGMNPHSIRIAEWEGRIPPIRRERWGDDRVFTQTDIDALRRYLRRP